LKVEGRNACSQPGVQTVAYGYAQRRDIDIDIDGQRNLEGDTACLPAVRCGRLDDEAAAVRALLPWSRPGDVLVLPVHNRAEHEAVTGCLHAGPTAWCRVVQPCTCTRPAAAQPDEGARVSRVKDCTPGRVAPGYRAPRAQQMDTICPADAPLPRPGLRLIGITRAKRPKGRDAKPPAYSTAVPR
jgi:hypothetical protein